VTVLASQTALELSLKRTCKIDVSKERVILDGGGLQILSVENGGTIQDFNIQLTWESLRVGSRVRSPFRNALHAFETCK
jgi:hypothetical protein